MSKGISISIDFHLRSLWCRKVCWNRVVYRN